MDTKTLVVGQEVEIESLSSSTCIGPFKGYGKVIEITSEGVVVQVTNTFGYPPGGRGDLLHFDKNGESLEWPLESYPWHIIGWENTEDYWHIRDRSSKG